MAQASLKIWIKLENQQATKLRNVPADADVDDVVLAAIEQLQSSLRDTSPGQVTVYDCSGNILERDQNVSELLARKCGDTTNTAMVFKYVEGSQTTTEKPTNREPSIIDTPPKKNLQRPVCTTHITGPQLQTDQKNGAKSGWLPGNKIWADCTTKKLRVHFMNSIPKTWVIGHENVSIDTDRVLEWANTWNQGDIPKFVRAHSLQLSDIRVKFNTESQNSISYNGTDAKSHPDEHTMLLYLGNGRDDYTRHTVVHEFGHALGLGHEHQRSCFWKHLRPCIDIGEMKKDLKVDDDMFETNWDEDTTIGEGTEYDPESVMHYWFKVDWLLEAYRDPQQAKYDQSLDADQKETLLKLLYNTHWKVQTNYLMPDKPSVKDIEILNRYYGQGPGATNPQHSSDLIKPESLAQVGFTERPDHWVKIFKTKLGVCTQAALELVGGDTYPNLVRYTKDRKEKEALQKLLGMRHEKQSLSFEGHRESQRSKLTNRYIKVQEQLTDLSKLNSERRNRQDKTVQHVENSICELLQSSGRITSAKSLDEVVSQVQYLIHSVNSLQATDIDGSALLKHASGGRALQGVLLTSKLEQQLKDRHEILHVPKHVQVMLASHPQCGVMKEFYSIQEEADFLKTMLMLGYSAAQTCGLWRECIEPSKMHSTNPMNLTNTQEQQGQYMSAIKYLSVPLASFIFQDCDLQLSLAAINDLDNIERAITTGSEAKLRELCKSFFDKYGSHVIRGPLHFGGSLTLKCSSQNFNPSGLESLKQIQNQCISIQLGISPPVNAGITSISQLEVASTIDMCGGGCSESTISQTSLEIKTEGGPSKCSSIPEWQAGLVVGNATWCLIDRGTSLIPIWEILEMNHKKGFTDASKLARVLKRNWEEMNDLQPATQSTDFQTILTHLEQVRDSISDDTETSKFRRTSSVSRTITLFQTTLRKQGQLDEFLFITTIFYPYVFSTGYHPMILNQLTSNDLSDIHYHLKCTVTEFNELKKEATARLHAFLFHLAIKIYLASMKDTCTSDSMDIDQVAEHMAFLKREIGKEIPPLLERILGELYLTSSDQLEQLNSDLQAFITSGQIHQPECNHSEKISLNRTPSGTPHTTLTEKRNVSTTNVPQNSNEAQTNTHKMSSTNSSHTQTEPSSDTTPSHHDDVHSENDFQSQSTAWDDENGSLTGQGDTRVDNLFDLLALQEFSEQKMSLSYALCIKKTELSKHGGLQKLHVLLLQKIMAYDYNCREDLLNESGNATVKYSKKDDFADDSEDESAHDAIHPMDSLLALLHCADDFLRQDLMARLVDCQLSIPLILPALYPSTPDTTLLIWALRAIVKEWKFTDQGTTKFHECPLVSYRAPVVSFIRFGKQEKSKSKMMNDVINDSSRDLFFHRDCQGGSSERLLGDGLVEIAWYLPAGKATDIFPDVVTFLNLHGDAANCMQQIAFLRDVSFMTFVLLTADDLAEKNTTILKQLSLVPGGVVLCTSSLPSSLKIITEDPDIRTDSLACIKLMKKNAYDIKTEMRGKINEKLKSTWVVAKRKAMTIEDCTQLAEKHKLSVDERRDCFEQGKKMAVDILEMVKKQGDSAKEKLLPLQHKDLWQKWAIEDKEEHRHAFRGGRRFEDYNHIKAKEKKRIRKQQLQYIQHLSPLMEKFTKSLLSTDSATVRDHFLQYLKLYLNNLSRSTIASWQQQYKLKRSNFLVQQKTKRQTQRLLTEIETLHKRIVDASLGLEHLLRELGQVYEAIQTLQNPNDQKFQKYSQLPKVAAELLINGHPLELMDGDAAHIPLKWVIAVISEVKVLLKNPRVFVLSVLGLQSTGKSTLINTTFGLKFNVSAGRCTRGAFMQLVPISDELRCEVNCDYILVVDTEGLRAPELEPQKMQQHDNELATFAIGIANETMINIYGETPGDMDDILQTAVHAFIRMRRVNLHPSCQFVHQNVTAVGASAKGGMGLSKFKDKLDKMTREAAKAEKREGEYQLFSDVIHFDEEKDVHHFPGLWKGDPPMAPVNPGYSEKALSLQSHLVERVKQSASLLRLSAIELQITDLWNALLHEKFVFSFKNTLEVTIYNSLEAKYVDLSWSFKSKMLEWERNAGHEINNSNPDQLKDLEKRLLHEVLPRVVNEWHTELEKQLLLYFEENEQRAMLTQWQSGTIIRLKRLGQELKSHAKYQCDRLIKSQKTREEFKKKATDYGGQLMSKVNKLVATLPREDLSKKNVKKTFHEGKLKEKFETEWSSWIQELKKNAPVHTEEDDIEYSVREALIEVYSSEEQSIRDKLQERPLSEWGKQLQVQLKEAHFNVKTKDKCAPTPTSVTSTEGATERQTVLKTIGGFIVNTFMMRARATSVHEPGSVPNPTAHLGLNDRQKQYVMHNVKMAFESEKDYLHLQQNENFNPAFTSEILGIVRNVIDKKDHLPDFNYTKEFYIDVQLTACGYAVKHFEEMRAKFLKEHDPIENLEREIKPTLFTVFRTQYLQTAGEKAAACTFFSLIAGSIRREVKESLGSVVFIDMKSLPHLVNKSALKGKILLDLGAGLQSTGDLSNYFQYLTNVSSSYKMWLQHYTMEHCKMHKRGEKPRLIVLANKTLTRLVECVWKEVERVTKQTRHEGIKVNEWLSSICSSLSSKLDVSVFRGFENLGGVETLKNVHNFTEEVQKELKVMQDKLKCEVECLTYDDLKTKPHEDLYSLLCGCTEQCPFCGEECDCTNDTHDVKHCAQQHRPECLRGWRYTKSEEMVTSVCNYSVGNDGNFKNQETDGEYFPYKRYQEKYPKWAIPVDMSADSTVYWKWFVGRYSREIAQHFGAKDNDIPTHWKEYTWEEAKQDVLGTYKI